MITDVAILAGGQARRMGGCPKGLIRVGEMSIVERLIAAACAINARPFFVGDHAAAYAHFRVPIIPDAIKDRGPPGGVLTALRQATGWTAVVALDLPFLDAAYLQALFEDGPEDAILPVHGQLQPLAGCWHPRALPALERLLADGRPGFGQICAELNVRQVEWADPRPFVNLNTALDVARILR